jgi:hypothetical protein
MERLRERAGSALLLTMTLGFVSTARAESIPPQPVDGKVRWVYSYAEGQRLARQTHKPLFVVFRCER